MDPKSTWTAVDRYMNDQLIGADDALDAALAASTEAGLPPISVAPNQGKLLHLIARMNGSKRILEIGTLGGYSTIWLARALPAGGKLVSLEADAKHAQVARANIARAGLSDRVDIRLGKALDTLPTLAAEKGGAFDLIFIDADKQTVPEYFRWSLSLSKPGSVIIIDNVVRDGTIADASNSDVSVKGIRRMIEMIAQEPRVSATTIQTVGTKGYDGLTIALVTA